MKKVVSILLAVVLAAGMLAVVPTASAAKPKKAWIQVDSLDSDFALVNQCNDCDLIVDTEHKMEGDASIKFDMEDFHVRPSGIFTYMALVLFDEPMDIDEYPVFEFNIYIYEDAVPAIGTQCVQVNFIDSDVDKSDGINTNNKLSGQLANTWARRQIDLTDAVPAKKKGEEIPLSRDNIDQLRISGLQYCDDFYEFDVNIDSLVFMTKDCFDNRSEEELSLANDLMAIDIPTQETIEDLNPIIEAALSRIEEDKKTYPNFLIDEAAEAHFDEVYNAYLTFNKSIAVQEAHDAIEAIGEVTRDNYFSEKKNLILTAEAKVEKLDELFGEEGYTLDNKQTLLDAREAYDTFSEEVTEVADMIDALPARAALKWDDRFDVWAARDAKDALTDNQQLELGSEKAKVLQADCNRIDELEPALVYGDIDDNGVVNSTDALIALQAASAKKQLDDDAKTRGDVDGNGSITSTDALLILQFASGKIDKFPIENQPQ